MTGAAALSLVAIGCSDDIYYPSFTEENIVIIASAAVDVVMEADASLSGAALPRNDSGSAPSPALAGIGEPEVTLPECSTGTVTSETATDLSWDTTAFDACVTEGCTGDDTCIPDACTFDGSVTIYFDADPQKVTLEYQDYRGSCSRAWARAAGFSSFRCHGFAFASRPQSTCTFGLDAFEIEETLSYSRVKARNVVARSAGSFEVQISALVEHPVYGLFDVTTIEDLDTSGCARDVPRGGQIELVEQRSDYSATVEFTSCDDFEICLDDPLVARIECRTHLWADVLPED